MHLWAQPKPAAARTRGTDLTLSTDEGSWMQGAGRAQGTLGWCVPAPCPLSFAVGRSPRPRPAGPGGRGILSGPAVRQVFAGVYLPAEAELSDVCWSRPPSRFCPPAPWRPGPPLCACSEPRPARFDRSTLSRPTLTRCGWPASTWLASGYPTETMHAHLPASERRPKPRSGRTPGPARRGPRTGAGRLPP